MSDLDRLRELIAESTPGWLECREEDHNVVDVYRPEGDEVLAESCLMADARIIAVLTSTPVAEAVVGLRDVLAVTEDHWPCANAMAPHERKDHEQMMGFPPSLCGRCLALAAFDQALAEALRRIES